MTYAKVSYNFPSSIKRIKPNANEVPIQIICIPERESNEKIFPSMSKS